MIDPQEFEQSVFINCPFDEEYLPLLQVLLFTVIQFGFRPRIATERSDSGEVRFKKIISLIGESKYSIHDLPRMEPLNDGEMPRFNMPFELGLDIGGRELGSEIMQEKCCLVLEKERFRYQAVLSDISGNDIKSHNGDPLKMVKALRNWFAENGVYHLASPTRVWDSYNDFLARLSDEIQILGYGEDDLNEIPISEYIYLITRLSEPVNA